MKLQYALDFLDADEALRHADMAARSGVHALEAGHVLIKVCGIEIVRELSRRFTGIEIVADMKTMDMAVDEVHAAAAAGADTVIVCGAASNGMIRQAVGAARDERVGLLVSLMGVTDRVRRARDLVANGVERIIAHRGIDDDFQWSDPEPRAELDGLLALSGAGIGLAGGINPSTLTQFPVASFERVIVGRGISAAADPGQALRSLVAQVEASSMART